MLKKLLFEDTASAFALKSDYQLRRAYLLFKMISYGGLVKIGTALTKMALKLNLPVEGLIRATVFDHFCGGVSEQDCLPVIDELYTQDVSSVLDYSVEGKAIESQFDDALEKILKIISFCEDRSAMPIVVFKPTGFGRFYLYQKITDNKALTPAEEEEWQRVIARYDKVCSTASEKDVEVLIDAEESWMQDAADQLAELMMEKYNKERPIVYNTLQCYRWDRLDYLKQLHKKSLKKGYKLGFKLVRGAYMEKERERALEKNYDSPICESKQATDQLFNDALTYSFKHIDDIALFIGTHNEASCYLATDLIEELQLSKNDSNIWFGQLYGMSDHISFNLAKSGYNVAKYIPFGPVKDVMPYLIRRAKENTSVAGQTSRELDLINTEISRRKLIK